ncbi:glycosyltransferase [Podospora aff. communis PSN243]|uniref:Glycosyltransferase n=1 Tax=Podospora aff. communis PSN243 TaxID=3040156 RepID=A0AAV9G530_9PEZI|nr:glycosyltransferase [Podospora aff. communis PSN243]
MRCPTFSPGAVDGSVLSTAGAILSATLAQSLSSRSSEIGSEALCWAIFSGLLVVERRIRVGRYSPLPSHSSSPEPPKVQSNGSAFASWLFVLGITVSSCFTSELGPNLLLPSVTPLFLAALCYLQPESKKWGTGGPSWTLPHISASTWGTGCIALAATVVLCDGYLDVTNLLWSIAPTIGILLAYLCLRLGTVALDGGPEASLAPMTARSWAVSLPTRTAIILAIAFAVQTAHYGASSISAVAPSLFFLGLFKALTWFFALQASREASWSVAPAIETYAAVINARLFQHASELAAMLELLICLLALSAVVGMAPKNARGRPVLWAFMVVPPALHFYQTYQAAYLSSMAVSKAFHPAEQLIQAAITEFDRFREGQSRSLTMAIAEYRRRYGMVPPPGFDDWYRYAMANKSPVIDDFDILHASIVPFLRLSGKEFVRATESGYYHPDTDVWLCSFKGNKKETNCNHPARGFDRNTALLFNSLLQNISAPLLDVSFIVNHLDEPRLLIPPSAQGTHFEVQDLTNHPSFASLTKHCLSSTSKAPGTRDSEVDTPGLPFVTNTTAAMDLCQNPSYAKQHGLLLSPTSFRVIQGLVPILSTGTLSTMGDIVFPSPAYTVEEGFLYDAAHGMEWEQKKNNLYWAGSTTGGFASSDSSWKDFHRQRFVALAQGKLTKHYYLQQQDGILQKVASRFLNRRLFDVDFTRVFICALRACRDEKDYFHTKSWADKDAALGSKLVFDLDGNGISGRYYKFLASKSAVLKQTLFREWHDDRLVPWVHYIPVSMGMEELPELVLWLTSTELGQARAKEIADNGREWFEQALRPVDRAIYLYRLLLELARLQDPQREPLAPQA